MNYQTLKNYLLSADADEKIRPVVLKDDLTEEKNRYLSLLEEAYNTFGDGDYCFISSPGRSEIGGNHTDHQHGHVVACALNIDKLAIVKKNDDLKCTFKDQISTISVDLSSLDKKDEEKNTSMALIRGIAYRLKELGYNYGGFSAICDSRVAIGSGISSSASFEVMIVEIFNSLFNGDAVNPVDRAIISQWAENNYFGKPCGLMDQMAISVGGFIAIDFKDPNEPVIDNYEFSFSDYGYEMVLVNTKGDHSDLSHEYAAVTKEIKDVAHELNVEYLRDSSMDELLKIIKEYRSNGGNDRGILRSIHFFTEDKRAVLEKEAIKNKDINKLINLMNESGRSSFEYLQNVYPASRAHSQSLAIGLALSDYYLKGKGAFRVHGGGFEGTIQVVMPKDMLQGYEELMSGIFGDDAVMKVKVRSFGTAKVM